MLNTFQWLILIFTNFTNYPPDKFKLIFEVKTTSQKSLKVCTFLSLCKHKYLESCIFDQWHLTNLVKILASINYSLVWTRIRVEIWSVRGGSWWHGARSRLAHTRWILSPTSPGYDFSISLSRRNIFIFPENERSSKLSYPERYQANETNLKVI